jgi:hypothetical protein
MMVLTYTKKNWDNVRNHGFLSMGDSFFLAFCKLESLKIEKSGISK